VSGAGRELEPARPIGYGELLRRNQDFRRLWGGQVVSQLGDWFSLITLQSLLLELTGSATVLAVLAVAQMMPGFALGPIAGVVVDRLPRKTVMIAADLARAALALGFLLVRSPGTVWIAYLAIAGLSGLSVFFEPARNATLPNVTRREELVTANALSAVTWSVLLTSGALAGGIVTTLLGRDAAFILNSLSFLGSAAFIQGVRVPPQAAPLHPAGFRDLVDGVRMITRRADLAALLTVKGAWGLTGGTQVLIPIFGQQLFPLGPGKGPLSISMLVAMSGVGTAFGPIVARRAAGQDPARMRWAIAAAYVIGGTFWTLLGHTTSLATAGAAMLCARFGGSIIWVFSTVLLQMAAEDVYRGRVFAAEQSVFTLTMALSSLATGTAIDRGVLSAFDVAELAGAISLAAGAAWMLALLRERRRSVSPAS
jgi:MFS family permease